MKRRYNNKDILYFTSDQHFFHESVLTWDKRSFSSIEDMNTALIDNIHKKVPKNGILVIAGDVMMMRKGQKYKDRLYEIFTLIDRQILHVKGNHDDVDISHPNLIAQCELLNLSVKDEEAVNGRQHITVCHFAMLSWEKKIYGSYLAHGDAHGGLLDRDTGYMDYYKQNYAKDIGVMNTNYEPISYAEFVKEMREKDSDIIGIKEKLDKNN